MDRVTTTYQRGLHLQQNGFMSQVSIVLQVV